MAMPTPHRRAFSQIQNTITKSTATISKNAIRNAEIGSTIQEIEKENIDQGPILVKNKEAVKTEKEEEDLTDFEVEGENFDYLKNIDFDAPIETCPQIEDDHDSIANMDVLPPEQRLSRFDPRYWNRLLMPPVAEYDFDFDNKENIYEDLYSNLTDECELDEIENGLANLELQKLHFQ